MVLNGELNLRRDRAVWEERATPSQVSACTGAATVRWRGRDKHFGSHARQGRETNRVSITSPPSGQGEPVAPGARRGDSSEVLRRFSLRVRGNNAK